MTPALERALKNEKLCYITTWDAAGKPGTVEIWFAWVDGKVYIATGAESLKVKKLKTTPRARIAIGSRKGPAIEGPVRIRKDRPTVEHVAPLLNGKYNHEWGANQEFIRRLVSGAADVLLECTPEKVTEVVLW